MPDLTDYFTDEQKEAYDKDQMSDEEFRQAEREAEAKFEEEIRRESEDPFTQDEKEQMGSTEFYLDD